MTEVNTQGMRDPFVPLVDLGHDASGSGAGANPSAPAAPAQPSARPEPGTPPTNISESLKNVPGSQPNAPDSAPEKHPAVQRAGLLRSIAETLAGGSGYKIGTDLNGNITRSRAPLDKKAIGMAIALEALTGGLAGLQGGRGRGMGAAGMAGVNQGVQQQQQRRETEDATFARQAAIAKTNMQMATNQRALAEADRVTHQKDVDSYASLYQLADKAHAIGDTVSEDQLHKLLQDGTHHITKDMAMPIRVVQRMGPDGTPMTGTHGEPLWEKMYAIVKPNAQLTIPEDVRKILVDNKVQGYVDSDGKAINLPQGLEARMHLIVDGIEKANRIRWMQSAIDGVGKGQMNPLHGDTVPGMKTASLPEVKDEKIASVIDAGAKKHGIDPGLLRSLVLSESQGNPNAASSKGAVGLGQLMPSTAAHYGVSDRKDPEQNIDGAARFLKDLIAKRNGDVREALMDYHGRGSDGNTTAEQYADQILSRTQVNNVSGETGSALQPIMSVSDALQQHILSDSALQLYQNLGGLGAFLNGDPAKGELSSAQKMAEEAAKKGDSSVAQSVGQMINFLGGEKAIDAERERRKVYYAKQVEDIAIDKQEREQRNKLKMDNENAEHLQAFLEEPPNFSFTPDMQELAPSELKKKLADVGVKVPANFSSLYLAGHYRSPISSFAPRTWAKGSPYEMDQQTASSYIQQFINPDFDVTKFAPKQKFRNELVSANSKDGSAIRNSGTASEHLMQMKQAADALAKNDTPLFNHYANLLGVKVEGDPGPTIYKAIAEKVNSEVEKVAMGGNAPYAEQLKHGLESLSSDFGPKTVDGVIKAYLGLMHGRIKTIDEASQSELQEHLHNVSPSATKLFRQYGLETPWEKNAQTQFQFTTKDGKMGYDGKQWVPIQGH